MKVSEKVKEYLQKAEDTRSVEVGIYYVLSAQTIIDLYLNKEKLDSIEFEE